MKLAQAGFDHFFGNQRNQHGQNQYRDDREPQVSGESDGEVGIDQLDRVVSEFGQDRVEGLDEHIDREGPRHGGKARGKPREGMPSDAQKRRSRERNQHQISSVGGDTGENAHEHQKVGERSAWRDNHELADQGVHKTRFLGHADADHRHDNQTDGGKAHEAGNERRIDEAYSLEGE